MHNYIYTRLSNAKQMTRKEYNDLKGWDYPENENQDDMGYYVLFDLDYSTWIPKEQFEKYSIKVNKNEKLKSEVSISESMVKGFIKSYEVIERDCKTTIVYATLSNGFIIVESSSCVDPANYSVEIGTEICLEKIYDQIWGLLGFMLQTSFSGIEGDK